ncbi:MAG: MFS transporter, partial [Lachnospiraceae bacterium]
TSEVNMQQYGVRITGMTNASNSFIGKIGSGIGASAIGWILAAGGYDTYTKTGELTQGVTNAVSILNIYIPIVIFAVMVLFMWRYDLEEKLPGIIAENDKISAQEASE